MVNEELGGTDPEEWSMAHHACNGPSNADQGMHSIDRLVIQECPRLNRWM